MRKRSSYVFLIPLFTPLFVLMSVFLAVTSGEAANVTGVSEDTIMVGMIPDQTGPTVEIQGPLADGVKTYFRYVNDQGGINGRKLKWVHEDDRYTVSLMISAFKKLIYKNQVFTMFLGGSTGGLLALQPMIAKEQVPVLGPPTSDILVVPPRKYYFTHGTSYEDEIKILFDYIYDVKKAKNPKIGLVRADTEHGKVGSRTASQQAELRHTKLVGEVIVSPGAIDATSEALILKMAGCDYVLLHTTTGNATAFVRSAMKIGYDPMYLGTKYAGAEDLVRLTGDGSKNFHIVNSFSRWYENFPGITKMKEINSKYNPKKNEQPSWFVQGWTHSIVLVEALKRAGKDLNREGLIKAYESFKDFKTDGLTGPITLGPGMRTGGEYVKLYKADVQNKRLIAITDWMKPSK